MFNFEEISSKNGTVSVVTDVRLNRKIFITYNLLICCSITDQNVGVCVICNVVQHTELSYCCNIHLSEY